MVRSRGRVKNKRANIVREDQGIGGGSGEEEPEKKIVEEEIEESEGSKKRKMSEQQQQVNESADSGEKKSTPVKFVGFRHIGSRRKNKPRRAAEVGVECK